MNPDANTSWAKAPICNEIKKEELILSYPSARCVHTYLHEEEELGTYSTEIYKNR